jgi:hypothetical protein
MNILPEQLPRIETRISGGRQHDVPSSRRRFFRLGQERSKAQNLPILRCLRKRLPFVARREQLGKLAADAEERVVQVDSGFGMLGYFLRDKQGFLSFGMAYGMDLTLACTLVSFGRDFEKLNTIVIANFIGTATELQDQFIDDAVHLLLRNFPAIIESQRDKGCEFHASSRAGTITQRL